ncbi:exportin-1-like [Planoprotostelium fungivorum]|uniref:Exportin-1-like n=1 Tax=Planoprotostelium fungivorum TaxID=1890364 RepID=A0A2P6NJG3_9EUKA|nr:exportin-1-like [Planoprotostelium fungivorum]
MADVPSARQSPKWMNRAHALLLRFYPTRPCPSGDVAGGSSSPGNLFNVLLTWSTPCEEEAKKFPHANTSLADSIATNNSFNTREAMDQILDFSVPLDVNLLDNIVNVMYTNPSQMPAAQAVLAKFQEHPEAWTRVATILENSSRTETRYIALQILEAVVKYKWKILPKDQSESIKTYIVNLAIKLSSDYPTLSSHRALLSKLDIVLVQIIKKEWPKNWERFIPEIIGASKTNEALCENNMMILRLMSEEVFDFSSGQMTVAKIKELKTSFNNEFSQIYQLCDLILDKSQQPSLLLVTLQTLLRFLNWIPFGYIFSTRMVDMLIKKFLPVPMFRNAALECLGEIASLNIGPTHDAQFEKLFVMFMTQLPAILPVTTDIADAYEKGTEDDMKFVQQLSIFFTGFFKVHLPIFEKPEFSAQLMDAHNYLAQISLVDDTEIFKICLEYWNKLASDLYHEPGQMLINTSNVYQRKNFYAPVLSKARHALIRRMPKPEEVLVVENEDGEIVREAFKDSDAITLYKSMRETLVFLTHLDPEDTQAIMLDKLQAQVDGTEWSWQNLNTLCWAIGAISGAQSEDSEKRFLVTVIKELLGLCECKKGKDNKAVVASDIMYVVGQYPRFLRAHWKFLKTVVNKLFEFMHENHPGVQDMACDTFLKISQKCRHKFVRVQLLEQFPFVDEILLTLPTIIQELDNSQIQTFYEAIGYMIQSQPDPQIRDNLIVRLMEMPNRTWQNIIAMAGTDVSVLQKEDTMKNIANILKTNIRACSSMGHCYISQLGRIYMDMLALYRAYSGLITNIINTGGQFAASTSAARAMRVVKKETLKLLECFIDKSEDNDYILKHFIPPLLETVLNDYAAISADTRPAEVLSLMVVIINKLQGLMTPEIPRIFESVFGCTLEMITKNFEDHPDHRLHFFTLLRAINQHCFRAFFTLNAAQFKLVIDSVVWAFKHTERHISETGLSILLELLKNISEESAEISSGFYKLYFIPLLTDIFYVLTDTMHKSAFKLQATILMTMFRLVETGAVTVPLWPANANMDPSMTNQRYLRQNVIDLLTHAFPNLSPNQVKTFVLGLFNLDVPLPAFKTHLRDFLAQMKEFNSGDNDDLFLEEKEQQMAMEREEAAKKAMAIPGFIPPNQLEDNMND